MDENRMHALTDLLERISLRFADLGLLNTALTHSSFVNENPGLHFDNNERLEYLGDAVLQLCISDILIRQFPDSPEGQLSKLRASLVRERPLAELSKKLSLNELILLGKGEDSTGGRGKHSILADTFEALLGAIYLDRGYDAAYAFITRLFEPLLEEHVLRLIERDAKSLLQELCQGKFKVMPEYLLLNEFGPDHDKTFQVKVIIGEHISAVGNGKSKKEAEQNAAGKALNRLQQNTAERKKP